MSESNEKGNLFLPEFQTMEQVIKTLTDRTAATGKINMATCVLHENLSYLVVAGNLQQIGMVSRLLATLKEQPVVKAIT